MDIGKYGSDLALKWLNMPLRSAGSLSGESGSLARDSLPKVEDMWRGRL